METARRSFCGWLWVESVATGASIKLPERTRTRRRRLWGRCSFRALRLRGQPPPSAPGLRPRRHCDRDRSCRPTVEVVRLDRLGPRRILIEGWGAPPGLSSAAARTPEEEEIV